MGSNIYQTEQRPRCPRCGQPMKSLSLPGQYYCINESCQVQKITITTREQWLEKRSRQNVRRQEELQRALHPGLLQL